MTHPPRKHKPRISVVAGCSLLACVLLGCTALNCEHEHSRKASPSSPPPGRHASEPPCPQSVSHQAVGLAKGKHLREISGVVASRAEPGLLWVHNDSGDTARIYGLSAEGETVATLLLPTQARDWEDIARAPGKDGRDDIYVADFGDNRAECKDGVLIHRFSEPTRSEFQAAFPDALEIKEMSTMRLRYPDGPCDAEALLVDPKTRQIVIITKPRMAPAEVFTTPTFSSEAVLTYEGQLSGQSDRTAIHMVTGADISDDGRFILIRTYDTIQLFHRTPGTKIAEALQGIACPITPALEIQGEAIGFLSPKQGASASGPQAATTLPPFVTVSEGVDPAIFVYRDKPSAR